MENISSLKLSGNLYRWACFSDRIVAAFSTRHYSHKNQSSFFCDLGLSPDKIHTVKQTHGDSIVLLKKKGPTEDILEADGIITAELNAAICIRTADCMPVCFEDSRRGVIGVIHAGWRGLHKGILGKAVRAFTKEYGTMLSDLKIGIGPFIHKENYRVGPEFKDYFPRSYDGGAETMDLLKEARSQLVGAGAVVDNIIDCGICTYSENARFYSVRREPGTEERILTVMVQRA